MKFVATFNLPDQTDRHDLATALEYHLGKAYEVSSSSVDATVWLEANPPDVKLRIQLGELRVQLEEERTRLLRNRKARQEEEFDPDCVGDEDYSYKNEADFKRHQHDDVLWLRAMHGANVNFRQMIRDLQK